MFATSGNSSSTAPNHGESSGLPDLQVPRGLDSGNANASNPPTDPNRDNHDGYHNIFKDVYCPNADCRVVTKITDMGRGKHVTGAIVPLHRTAPGVGDVRTA